MPGCLGSCVQRSRRKTTSGPRRVSGGTTTMMEPESVVWRDEPVVAGSESEGAHRKVWALRAARVFDGETLHKDSPLVVIDGSRIATIDGTAARPSDDLRVLDLGDATLLPGLTDSHVHLAFDPESASHQTIVDEENPTILTRMRRHALQQLRAPWSPHTWQDGSRSEARTSHGCTVRESVSSAARTPVPALANHMGYCHAGSSALAPSV